MSDDNKAEGQGNEKNESQNADAGKTDEKKSGQSGDSGKSDSGQQNETPEGVKDLPENIQKWIANLASKAAKLNEVKNENQEMKSKLSELESEKKNQEEAKLKEQGKYKEVAEQKDTELKTLQAQLIRQEIRLQAIKAGIIDPDVASLINADSVKRTETGEIIGAEEAVRKFKEEKSNLFSDGDNSAQTSKTVGSDKKTPSPGSHGGGNATKGEKVDSLLDLQKKDPKEYVRQRNEFIRSGK